MDVCWEGIPAPIQSNRNYTQYAAWRKTHGALTLKREAKYKAPWGGMQYEVRRPYVSGAAGLSARFIGKKGSHSRFSRRTGQIGINEADWLLPLAGVFSKERAHEG